MNPVFLLSIVISFVTYGVLLSRNERRWHRYEAVLPIGFIILYLAIAAFGLEVSPTVCALR